MIIVTGGAAGEDRTLQQLGAGDALQVVTPLVPLQHGQGGGGGEDGVEAAHVSQSSLHVSRLRSHGTGRGLGRSEAGLALRRPPDLLVVEEGGDLAGGEQHQRDGDGEGSHGQQLYH